MMLKVDGETVLETDSKEFDIRVWFSETYTARELADHTYVTFGVELNISGVILRIPGWRYYPHSNKITNSNRIVPEEDLKEKILYQCILLWNKERLGRI